MTEDYIDGLVIALEEANYNYHNGLPLTMSDAVYDAALEELRQKAPFHPFLSQIGAAVAAGDEVALPVPLPSLNKLKPNNGTLEKWMGAPLQATAQEFHLSTKLDGCSALWISDQRRLFTRGDGLRGRDVSVFAPLFKGCIATTPGLWVRGELIMRTDSPAVPPGKLARNIVAGALNRIAVGVHEADTALFGEIRFVAYELIKPHGLSPKEAYVQMRLAGFEVARSRIVSREGLTEEALCDTFTVAEEHCQYQLDGIVVAPNVGRTVAAAENKNPADRIAWKTRRTVASAQTTVAAVEWNISASGVLIPRVLFDPPVQLSGATIGAATGIHAAWIRDNGVGPGARIEVRRAGDVIPQITAVLMASPAGPSLPTVPFVWDSVHIRPAGDSHTEETLCIQLTHALRELGAENVSAGVVARLVKAGYRSVQAIYAAAEADFATNVEGVKAAGAKRIWEGLRAKGPPWTEIQLMKASCVFPRGIGAGRLEPLLAINPAPMTWTAAEFKAVGVAGVSAATIDSIVAAIPAYLKWRQWAPSTPPPDAAATPATPPAVVVLTGFRDKVLEAALAARGHTVSDTITKKTTHLVHPDGPTPTTGKAAKAAAQGISIMSITAFRATFAL